LKIIKIANRYLEEKQYIREVLWLKYDVKRRLLDLLDQEFIILKDVEKSFDHLALRLYNENLNLNLEFEFKSQANIL